MRKKAPKNRQAAANYQQGSQWERKVNVILGAAGDEASFEKSIKAIIDKLEPDGYPAIFKDGTKIAVVDEEVVDTTKSGSAQYQWDKSGNKCLHNRVRVTTKPDGTVVREHVRKVYKEPE